MARLWIGCRVPITERGDPVGDGEIGVLRGTILSKIEPVYWPADSIPAALVEKLLFYVADGNVYKMYHDQDCCESVYLEDVAGDLGDLIGTPILAAYESSSHAGYGEEEAGSGPLDRDDGSYTWTFYNISTIKGSVTFRWYGTSIGYYSESVNFVRVDPNTLQVMDKYLMRREQ
jgi:hypothetical protein